MPIIGIYKISSIAVPNRIYIGSAVNIKNRWRDHLRTLRKNKHHSQKLQRHYNKYKESDLVFSIVEECGKENLLQREQYYIDTLKPYFNICKIAGSSLGIKRNQEYIDKMKMRKGDKSSRYGAKLTPEHIKKLIESSKNRIVTNETKEKLRQANLGKKASFETRQKMSASHMGHPGYTTGLTPWNKGKSNIYTEETIRKIKEARGRQVFTKESQRKKSETMKKIWELRRNQKKIV